MARGKAGNIGNIGKAGNIAGEENDTKQVEIGNQRPKSVVRTTEKKRLKFHNVFFDKVMEMKEVQVNKETPKKSCRSKKRKATVLCITYVMIFGSEKCSLVESHSIDWDSPKGKTASSFGWDLGPTTT